MGTPVMGTQVVNLMDTWVDLADTLGLALDTGGKSDRYPDLNPNWHSDGCLGIIFDGHTGIISC